MGARAEVLWIGPAPGVDVEREFARRDLAVRRRALADLPGALGHARAVVLAMGDAGDILAGAPVLARAGEMIDLGVRLEVVAANDGILARILAGGCLPRHELVRFRVGPPAHRLAEDVARYQAGPVARSDLEIVLGANQPPLSRRDVPLFQRAFHDCTRIVLVELRGGRSEARVFAVHETLAGSYPGVRPQPSFAKVDESGKIHREFRNYRDHADRYIPFGLRPNVRGVVQGHRRSLLVGDFVDRSESLWDLVRRGVAAQPLASLVTETLAGWRDQGYARDPVSGSVARVLADRGVCDLERVRPEYAEWSGDSDLPHVVWGRLAGLRGQSYRAAPFHGDLHGDNVRVRNGHCILIDLASVQRDGPLTADLAALETWLAFERGQDDADGEYVDVPWRGEIDRLYAPGAFVHPPGPCDPTCAYAGEGAAVRQLRQMGIAAQTCPGEYQTAVAVMLLRRCQWEAASPADLYRRATGYGIAATLARDLEASS